MKSTTCLTTDAIQAWLADSLPHDQANSFEEHLGDCPTCQRAVENVLADSASQPDFEQQLKHVFHSAAALTDATASQELAFGTGRQSDSEAMELLGPTDDPKMLGRLGRYEVSGVIGSGATSYVYKALDTALNRIVALKLLSPSLAHLGASRKRFQREGRAIAAVRDPHVVDVYGVESHNGMPFIVMQYVSGGSLQSRLDADGEMRNEAVIRIGLQVARGLAAAHSQGIIHRDIKPSNILMEPGGDRAIVSDFGLAHVAGDAPMTQTGMIAGTPQYMSPEQADARTLDVRTDLFSLGAVLYAACTGQPPFRQGSILGILRAVTESEPPAIRQLNPQVPPWLEGLIRKLMSKEPDARLQTASEVAQVLSEELSYAQSPEQSDAPQRDWWAESRPDAPKPSTAFRPRTIVVLLGLSCLLIGGYAISQSGSTAIDSNGGRTNRPDQLPRADGLRSDPIGASDRADYLTKITPTTAELNHGVAKAAYDLSYETHVQEASLSGDMQESIERHIKAMRLGYDPARSAFNLARAYALEGRTIEAIEYLRIAINAGFCDSQATETHRDLRRIRKSSEFLSLLKKIADSESELDQLKSTYFLDAEYSAAAELAKQRLAKYPNDEFAQLLLAGALTEIAFLDRSKIEMAKIWNQRIRDSVRYANFGSYNLGCIALMEGKIQSALDHLHYAASTGFTDSEHLVNDPMLAELHNDPRFTELAKTMLGRSQSR